MSEWISVKDRLPPHEQFVVVASNIWRWPKIAYFGDRKLEHANLDSYFMSSPLRVFFKDLDVVTHWMPLPELPKEDR